MLRRKNVISPLSSVYYIFSVNYIFLMNITYVFAIITCLGFLVTVFLKAKKTHGFNSCIVISVYPLDILLIKKAIEYRNN